MARQGERLAIAALALGVSLAGAFGSLGTAASAAKQDAIANSAIFFLGDGMGQTFRDAGRLYTVGAYGQLVMDSLPIVGLVGTNAAMTEDGFITDSAAAATAYFTGVKTINGAVGVDPDGQTVANIAELAKAAGKSVGIVTTSQVSDASGAAVAAHVASRRDQSEIARQMIEDVQVDVILGGGESRWLPEGSAGAYPDNPPEDPEEASVGDKGDLIARAQELGYDYVSDAEGLNAATGPKVLGLFANEEMFQQFPEGQGDVYEPVVSLEEMTAKAIEILSQNPNGFFLFVEEEATDELGAANNATLALKAVQELDKAVARGVAYAEQSGDTLIVVTADHDVAGLAVEAVDDAEEPDESGAGGTGTAMATPAAGEETATISGEDGPFPVADSDQMFIIDWTTPHHVASRVPLTAMGPGAEALAGAYENTEVFDALVTLLGLDAMATPTP